MNSIPKIMAIITHNDNMIKDRDELVGLVLEVANDVSKLEVEVTNLKSENVQLRQENVELRQETAQLRQHIHELDMKMNKVLQGLESKNERQSVKARAIKA